MKLLYTLLKVKPGSREGVIIATSALGILVNIVISVVKIVIGALASSIAILSEGVNNATDALTSLLTIVGVKLSRHRPTEKHPFGFGRIEYLTSLIIALLICFTGVELIISSVQRIQTPEDLKIDVLTLVILAVSGVIKFLLGTYTIKKGKEVESDSLIGVGTDCRNDAFISLITIAASLIFLVFHLSLDAYAGIIVAAIIIKSGVELLLSTLSNLLGKTGNKELADQLYHEIRSTDGILNAADMMLHNYGPDSYSASVNIEIDHERSIGEIYQVIHELQLRIMHEYHVTMVFGMYAVDNKTEGSRQMRREIASFVQAREEIRSFHALYHDKKANCIYCDFVVGYDKFDEDALRAEFTQYMQELYPNDRLELTIETEFV